MLIPITLICLIHAIGLEDLSPQLISPAGEESSADEGARRVIRLDQGWTLERNGHSSAAVPGCEWETPGFEDFDGIGTYRLPLRELRLPDQGNGGRVLLEVSGAATRTEVLIGNQLLGEHLGAWTPFRIDVTELCRMQAAEPTAALMPSVIGNLPTGHLTVNVDELVGHNTQGFLPVILPHFGGLWKSVRLIETAGPVYLDDLTLLTAGFDGEPTIRVTATVRGPAGTDISSYEVSARIIGPGTDVGTDWSVLTDRPDNPSVMQSMPAAGTDTPLGTISGSLVPARIRRWSPEDPFLYDIELRIRDQRTGRTIDRLHRHAAIRHVATSGRRLLLNGRPVAVRGVLNWGYAPPRISPTTDESAMRRELIFLKERGFNLMKFCLWVPPKRYLELADEMGIMTWIEYPTWHPEFSAGTADDLEREFTEFFCYDRNTAGTILRSLTCETGHTASLDVMTNLYQLGHRLIPGAVIEDDSSWIGWHRIHDFYDDHPYGNNHSWVPKLRELDAHIRQRDAKPLMLGEAIAADTWELPDPSIQPPHASWSAPDYQSATSRLLRQHGLETDQRIREDSYRAAFAMRKYQMEAFRAMLPEAGYVVSVLRDFPKAAMGLVDRQGRPKWTANDYRWHGAAMLSLNPERAERAIAGDRITTMDLILTENVERSDPALLTASLTPVAPRQTSASVQSVRLLPHDHPRQHRYQLTISLPAVDRPQEYIVAAEARSEESPLTKNEWPLWIFPDPHDPLSSSDVYVRPGSAITVNFPTEQWPAGGFDTLKTITQDGRPPIVITSKLTLEALEAIRAGVRCLILPDGRPGSPVIRNHWFLRGGPVVAGHPFTARLGPRFLADIQAFDLAGPILPEFPLIDCGTPLLSLWDNHDLDHYRTHSLLWQTRIGRGSLIVSSLNHQSPAGEYILRELIRAAADGITADQIPSAELSAIERELKFRSRSLADAEWHFRPARPTEVDRDKVINGDWKTEEVTATKNRHSIRITSHWDGQGHADLDGWGFYRTEVATPAEWRSGPLFLSVTGVDDYFDDFVNGISIGSGGNIPNRETAFELRRSYLIPDSAIKEGPLQIAVQVYDWYGAGGIFRPVSLSNSPIPDGPPLLVPPTASPE